MTFRCKLFALMVLPGLAAAADREMLKLVMPDANFMMELNVSKIMASPVGAAMEDAFQQGIAAQLKGGLADKPEVREQIALLKQIDWGRQVADILIAARTGQPPSALVIVRSSLRPEQLESLGKFTGKRADLEGVPVLASDNPANGVVAFLDNSIVLLGQPADVKAAIERRSKETALPEALAARVTPYGDYDFWLAGKGPFRIPQMDARMGSAAGANAAKAQAMAGQVSQFLAKLTGFNAGVRFSPDLDVAADIDVRTEKDAAAIAQTLQLFSGTMQVQARRAASGFEGFQYQQNGRRIHLTFHLPEAQLRAGLQQIRAAQAQAARSKPAVSAGQVPAAAPSSGLPPPPAGTIRAQSSAMGTVLIPTGQK